jgi:hypothetical protein
MGLGYPRGGPRGGRGRGGFQNSNDFNQAPQNENLVAPPSEGSEKVQSTAPITTQSGNNVQVVTTGGPPAAAQPSSQQQGQLQQQSTAPIQSNVSMNNPPPSRGHRMDRGRGFGSRGSFGGRGGRGSFGQSMPPPRQQYDTRQPSNLTQTLPPKMSRYDQQGSMQPPKRGRYDSGPYMGNRNITPNQPPPMTSQHHHHQQGSYNSMPP